MSQAAHIPHRVPETMNAAELGAYMAQLRHQFKLSVQDVSERLHIRSRYVAAIEEGKYDVMPGKAYARGYVHTYAEFLGLDAVQVVDQCFAGELPSVATAPLNKPMTNKTIRQASSPWRGITIAVAAALVLMSVLSIFSEESETSQPVTTAVAPVPEAMLATVRTNLMPTPQNYECLTGSLILTCFFESSITRELMDFEQPEHLPFAGKLRLPPPVPLQEEEVVEEKTETGDE